MEDVINKIENLRKKVYELKRRNEKLKKENKMLIENNMNLVYLVEIMNERIKKLTDMQKKHYRYSFEDGGWIEENDMNKRVVEIFEKKDLNINDINRQLYEVLRLLEIHKKRLKREKKMLKQ